VRGSMGGGGYCADPMRRILSGVANKDGRSIRSGNCLPKIKITKVKNRYFKSMWIKMDHVGCHVIKVPGCSLRCLGFDYRRYQIF
jgi:hypothetical protein